VAFVLGRISWAGSPAATASNKYASSFCEADAEQREWTPQLEELRQIDILRETGKILLPMEKLLRERAMRPGEAILGFITNDRGRYRWADPFKAGLTILEKASRPDDPELVSTISDLGAVLEMQGRYPESQQFFEKVLEIRENVFGPDAPEVITALRNLAALLIREGRNHEAESLLEKALLLLNSSQRQDWVHLEDVVHELFAILEDEHRFGQAERLLTEELKDIAKHIWPNDPLIPIMAHLLVTEHHYIKYQGRNMEVAEFFRHALDELHGTESRITPDPLLDLGILRYDQRRYAEAEQFLMQGVDMLGRALGPKQLDASSALNTLGLVLQMEGRSADAEMCFCAALRNQESALGSNDPGVAQILANLARVLMSEGQPVRARATFERARSIWLKASRERLGLGEGTPSVLGRDAARSLAPYAGLLADITDGKVSGAGDTEQSKRDAFVVAEQIHGRIGEAALAAAATRAAGTRRGTAPLVRKIQDLTTKRRALERLLHKGYSAAETTGGAALLFGPSQNYEALQRELAAAVERLRQAFPRYAEVAAPYPINPDDAAKLLRPDEALVSYLALEDRLLIWLVRPAQRLVLHQDPAMPREKLGKVVMAFRESLLQNKIGDLPPVDLDMGYELYSHLVAPLRLQLAGINHLIIVPDDALVPLPFAALVTNNDGEAYRDLAERSRNYKESVRREHSAGIFPKHDPLLRRYAEVAWLGRDYALTELPSATSLRLLRGLPYASKKPSQKLLGIGDPILEGCATASDDAIDAGAAAVETGQMLALHGTAGEASQVRCLQPLPRMEHALNALADALKVPDTTRVLFLKDQATKPKIEWLDQEGRLGDLQVLAFATHGLIAGEIKGLREPALVLTPPTKANETDDGLLHLDDIIKLHLDGTRWVVLSACNTGAPEGVGQGLSGLVRAFFFAGSPTLLVSHWSVGDEATDELIKKVFLPYGKDQRVAPADAVQQGMLAMLKAGWSAGREQSYFAHPFAWASFFLVGEGEREPPEGKRRMNN
jgi:CHAT domain-containing protein/tetratricopeptide (TPR) repeat protein